MQLSWRTIRSRAPGATYALGWFVAALAVIVFAYGLAPTQCLTPDEAVNRRAGIALAETGSTAVPVPFEDPEDLAHARGWHSLGTVAVPIYPPVSLYFYGLVTALGRFGFVLLAALTATGAAAFAAAFARLLPAERRFLAVLAPALGTPALYWLVRPWMNIGGLLVPLCWATYLFSLFREGERRGFLVAALACAGIGVAVRPDAAAYVLPIVVLLLLAAAPRHWRTIVVAAVGAGLAAVGLNLVLNHLVTGHAFRAAYQLVLDRDGPPRSESSIVGLVRALTFPLGFPSAGDIASFVYRYWIRLFPMPLLLVGQLALVPLLRGRPRRERALVLGAILLACAYMLSRMSADVYGGARAEGFIRDSTPRYWSPILLAAALPPLLFLGQRARGAVFVAGSCGAAILALASVGALFGVSTEADEQVRATVSKQTKLLDDVRAEVPADAMIYSLASDKVFWSAYRVGTVDDPARTAQSLARAVNHGLPTFVLLRGAPSTYPRDLGRELGALHLRLTKSQGVSRFYRVDR